MADVTTEVANIRAAILGIDVRESIASGIESINTEVVSTTARQTVVEGKENVLEGQFNSLVINAGSSNAEIVAGRTSSVTSVTFDTMGHRADGVDAQLADTALQLNSMVINVKYPPVPMVGAKGDGVADAEDVAINAIIAISTGIVYIPDGTYIISGQINLKSNMKLLLSPGAIIKTKDGAQPYTMISAGGIDIPLVNVFIEGGTFDANYRSGTRKGNAIQLFEIDGLIVRNIKIIDSGNWGIQHFGCNNFLIENITFDQAEGAGINSDGITGSSTNGTIRNIKGYTNDDMVAVGSMIWSKTYLTENIVIENIFPAKKNNSLTWVGVAVYASDNLITKNVTIRNVQGYTTNCPIRVMDYKSWDTAQGIKSTIQNITIDNVKVTTGATATTNVGILLETATIKGLRVSNIQINHATASDTILISNVVADTILLTDVEGNPSTDLKYGIKIVNSVIDTITAEKLKFNIVIGNSIGVFIDTNTVINHFNIDKFLVNYIGATNSSYGIYDTGKITNLNMTNIAILNVSGESLIYYRKNTVDTTISTRLNLVNVNSKPENGANNIAVVGKVIPNGVDIKADKTMMIAENGNMINNIDGALCIGVAGIWKTVTVA